MSIDKDERRSNLQSEITVYGATGFVARYVCEYLFFVCAQLPTPPRITMAGRNENKLKARLSEMNAPSNLQIDIFIADCSDLSALTDMVSRTGVVMQCAGPFTVYGSKVVEACATTGADYVDITGEVDWASRMRDVYGEKASKSGSRIVSFCGFDSIPSDLSVFGAVQTLREHVVEKSEDKKEPVNITHASTWHAVIGLANGGTLHSALDIPINAKACLVDFANKKLRNVPFLVNDPFAMAQKDSRDSSNVLKWKDEAAKSEWVNMLPSLDKELDNSTKPIVSIPFFMAAVNAKIVYASAMANQYCTVTYSKHFTYRERTLPAGFNRSKKIGILSAIPAILFTSILSIFIFIFKFPIFGKRLAMWLLPPGSGSPDALNRSGYADVYARVDGECGGEGEDIDRYQASCLMQFKGDPGNLVTAQCLSESALCLTLHRSDLPKRSSDGFGTPAQTFGIILLKRLVDAKVRPVTMKTNVWKLKDADKNKKD